MRIQGKRLGLIGLLLAAAISAAADGPSQKSGRSPLQCHLTAERKSDVADGVFPGELELRNDSKEPITIEYVDDPTGLLFRALAPFSAAMILTTCSCMENSVSELKPGSAAQTRTTIFCLAISPDGQTVAAGDSGGSITFWDVATRNVRHRIAGDGPDQIYAVGYSPDGKLLAWAEMGGGVVLWNLAEDREAAVLQGHRGPAGSLAFSPDGKTLVSGGGSGDATLRIWDVATRKERVVVPATDPIGPINAVASSPDGKTIAATAGDAGVKLYDMADGRVRATIGGKGRTVICLAFSPDGKTLATGDGGAIHLWDFAEDKPEARERLTLTGFPGVVQGLAFSPDGTLLASAGGPYARAPGFIKLWDPSTGRERSTLEVPEGPTRCVAFAPDGQTLVADAGKKILFRTRGEWKLAPDAAK